MDGRRLKRWAAIGLAAAAVGCTRTETVAPQTGLPPLGERTASLLPAKPGFSPAPPPAEPAPSRPRRKGEPMKPETLAAVADTEVEAAFMPGTPGTQRDQLLDVARGRYQAALKADPSNKPALVGLSRMYRLAGDQERSVATLRQAIDLDPSDHALTFQLCRTCFQFGDWSGAEAACRRALAADPENRSYLKTLGLCLAHQERWDEAFDAVLKVMPEADGRVFLGRVLADRGQTDAARQQMELALKSDPRCDAARDFQAKLGGEVQQAGAKE